MKVYLVIHNGQKVDRGFYRSLSAASAAYNGEKGLCEWAKASTETLKLLEFDIDPEKGRVIK